MNNGTNKGTNDGGTNEKKQTIDRTNKGTNKGTNQHTKVQSNGGQRGKEITGVFEGMGTKSYTNKLRKTLT